MKYIVIFFKNKKNKKQTTRRRRDWLKKQMRVGQVQRAARRVRDEWKMEEREEPKDQNGDRLIEIPSCHV